MIEAIYIAADEAGEQVAVEGVTLVSGKGIVGDRYFDYDTQAGEEITFIEIEEIERYNRDNQQQIPLHATRRNIITRGVRLNDLEGKEFTVGGVRFRGVELCEPCAFLGENLENDTMDRAAVVKAFLHRAGLRADILCDGDLAIGIPFGD